MQPSPAKFSARAIKASWRLGTASLDFSLFIKITSEPLEHEVSGVDRTILSKRLTNTPVRQAGSVLSVRMTAKSVLKQLHHISREGFVLRPASPGAISGSARSTRRSSGWNWPLSGSTAGLLR